MNKDEKAKKENDEFDVSPELLGMKFMDIALVNAEAERIRKLKKEYEKISVSV